MTTKSRFSARRIERTFDIGNYMTTVILSLTVELIFCEILLPIILEIKVNIGLIVIINRSIIIKVKQGRLLYIRRF